MNSLLLISPEKALGFKPILSGKSIKRPFYLKNAFLSGDFLCLM
ncbi:hypothetical protein QUB63_17655 [Microcoleus sp. ARI1-B5]